MTFNQFLQKFVAKEERFFPLFIQQAELAVKASEYLRAMLDAEDQETREDLRKKIKQQEKSGDDILLEFNHQLTIRTLTPFDRDDMHELAQSMDDLLDRIDDSANVVATHAFESFGDNIKNMTDNIVRECGYLLEIMNKMPDMLTKADDIYQLCIKIKEIEHENDDHHDEYMNQLFKRGLDLIGIIKRKDMVHIIEKTTDFGKYCADKVRSIMTKQ